MDPDGRGYREKVGGIEGGETNQDILCEEKVALGGLFVFLKETVEEWIWEN